MRPTLRYGYEASGTWILEATSRWTHPRTDGCSMGFHPAMRQPCDNTRRAMRHGARRCDSAGRNAGRSAMLDERRARRRAGLAPDRSPIRVRSGSTRTPRLHRSSARRCDRRRSPALAASERPPRMCRPRAPAPRSRAGPACMDLALPSPPRPSHGRDRSQQPDREACSPRRHPERVSGSAGLTTAAAIDKWRQLQTWQKLVALARRPV